ncbi:MAG: response regulator transcription factor [Candidatus Acidiferrales bacterium]|jgi:DNA-binding response OmpR family regulator
MRILVAEKDPALGTLLERGFGAENYSVDLTADGETVKSMVRDRSYDAAILDLDLAQDDGLDVLRHVRSRQQQLPILTLTSRARAEERVEVLDSGADDLVIKPFAFAELSARVRALLRRGGRIVDAALRVDDLELSRVSHVVSRAGRSIELTPKEFALLEYLMRNAGRSVTRAQIVEHVWNLSHDTMTNIVDVYVNYLRKKVDAGSDRKLIRTIRGVGYRLQAQG